MALFLSCMAKLQINEETNLEDSRELVEVSMSARDCFRSGLRDRLKRVNKESVWMIGEEEFVSEANVGMALSV